jgi:hypothetical protein
VLRIAERAVEIPREFGVTRIETAVNYRRVRIGERDVLLPVAATEIILDSTGALRRNETAFTRCREFRSDSQIRFDEPLRESGSPNPDRKK